MRPIHRFAFWLTDLRHRLNEQLDLPAIFGRRVAEGQTTAAVLAIFDLARDVKRRRSTGKKHPHCHLRVESQGLKQVSGKPVFADVRAHSVVTLARGEHFHGKAKICRDAGGAKAECPHRAEVFIAMHRNGLETP